MDKETAAVRRAVDTYRRDTARANASRERLYDTIRAARAAGKPQVELARITGFTREHLRRLTSDPTT